MEKITRRDALKTVLIAGGSAGLTLVAEATEEDLLKYLCPPDSFPDQLTYKPSPPAATFKAPLFVPPIAQPVAKLDPPPDPQAHQRYEQFKPKKFYELYEKEFLWKYHPDAPYGSGSWSWGFWAKNDQDRMSSMTPGTTFHAYYGEPVLVRRINDLPPVGASKVTFALPSTTMHLHNAHTASESDGNPQDWIDSGEYWDHHYGNFPLGGSKKDPTPEEREAINREKLNTLWYHDHRLDFTAANVYAGLSGFYFLFDDRDTGNEKDPAPAWKLPSGKYDVPLILHDVKFKDDGQVDFSGFETDGWLGDHVTVNRTIRPHLDVERRKYRFRLLNGGPSRFYRLFLKKINPRTQQPEQDLPFTIITGDGNVLPEPIRANSVYLSVAQRVDVVVDFSQFNDGDQVVILNRLEQVNGKGPSGRLLDPDPDPADPTKNYFQTGVIRFNVKGGAVNDPSRIPDTLRPLPTIDMSEVKRERTWVFDYDGGLWTINSRVMDPNRIDAGIEIDSAEIWTLLNGGNEWSHPIHSHFTEFLLLEVNGKPFRPSFIQSETDGEQALIQYLGIGDWRTRPPIHIYMGGPRRDVATLLPNDEIKLFMRWKDFLGKHVMHCHNVVHEDHAMMIRWDIMEPGKGFAGPKEAEEVYTSPPPYPDPRPPAPPQLEERPGSASIGEG